MDKQKEKVYAEIDAYYDMLMRKLQERGAQVKEEYKEIEQREK